MEKKRLLVYGAGNNCKRFFGVPFFTAPFEIVAVADSNEAIRGTIVNGFAVSSPEVLKEHIFDYVLITPDNYSGIVAALYSYGVTDQQIIFLGEMELRLAGYLKEKYSDSSDKDVQKFLSASFSEKNHRFNIFGSYCPDESYDKVFFDKGGSPYIIFENQYHMYFPKTYKFTIIDGEKYVKNLMWEQQPGSPHLYVNHDISGDTLIDAGTCEGNFALRFVDNFKQIYLIEGDPEWAEALRKTFAPFGEKVHIIDKFLSRYDTETSICLDSLPISSVDFLKMDIEGAEVDALLGGKRLLSDSHCRASICSYHRAKDVENISFLMKCYGYQTDTSDGYMCFVFDQDGIIELRHGIVYAEKL